jgi:nucleotide-binding universal stress UspA family protein
MYVARPPDGIGEFAALHGHFLTAAEEMRGGLESYRAAEFEGIETDSIFRTGHPVPEIVEFARLSEASLIMMATRGYSAFRQMLLGSVTSGVLHDAQCPVWTCAHAAGSTARPPGGHYRSIVCALDLGPASEAVFISASAMAATFGAGLRVVHVGQPAPQAPVISAPIEFLSGDGVVASVIAAAKQCDADLLVIGRGHAQGLLGRLRSNAHDLIRLSHCPVLSV